MQRRRKSEKKPKLNKNAGFSLVELLIAITILAIIVIPLLNVFLTSNRLNVKSRQTLRATTMAQDIMEGLKAYDIAELKEQFNNPSEGFYVIDGRMVKGEIKEETSLEVDEHGDPCDGLYYFSMSKVALQGTEYDALIKVDARDYMEGGLHTGNQPNGQAHNNDGIAKIGNVNNNSKNNVENGLNKDGLYQEKASLREDILRELGERWDELDPNGVKPKDISYTTSGLTVSRDILVEIVDSGTKDEEDNIIADAAITLEYQCHYGDKKMLIHRESRSSFTSGNFYLFYYPMYEAVDECITIDNKNNLPLCITIAKQIDTTTDAEMTDAQLSAAEDVYRVVVDFLGCTADKIKVRTNLGTNLVNSRFLGAEGKPSKILKQVVFQLNGVVKKDLNIYDLSGVRNTDLGSDGTDDEITELIYDVEVAIYEEGAAADGFQDEDKKITIQGSKNN